MDMPPTFAHDDGAPARLSMEGGAVPLELAPFFHAMPTPCLLLTPQQRIFAANQAYLRLSGCQRGDLIGRHLVDVLPGELHDCLSDGWKVQDIPVHDAGGELHYIMHMVEQVPDFRLAGKDTLRDVLANLSAALRELQASSDIGHAEAASLGREVAALILAATEREHSAAALGRSEAKFRTITDAMPQMVWSTLPDGYHDFYNKQWYSYTGVPYGSTNGAGWNDIFHPDDRERAWAAWHASLATGNTYEIQYRLRHHSGSYRWVLGRALPIRADDGSITRWMGTCTDIDDQKRAEDELRRLGARKDEFLAMLAHELRNPLAPISSAAQLLLLGASDVQRVQKSAGVIQRQVRHLTNLVDDLLDVSRVTRGLVQLDRRVLDLREVLHGAIEQLRPAIEVRGHRLELVLPPAVVAVHGDRTRLVQVVANLLANAAKYMAPGGRIELSLQLAQDHACITVSDDGIGMAPDLLPHVFELFVQAERTPDRAQGGLGLGLALVQRIVELHGGTVQAASPGLGQGSTLTVCLPLAQAHALHGEAASLQEPVRALPPATAQLPSVLLLDDHVDGARMLGTLLRARGFEVTVAHDGDSVLRMAQSQCFDVFILDIGLPGMDGYELARRLRAGAATAQAQLIALTGYGKQEDRRRAFEAGFDHHLVKPVDLAQLLALLVGRSQH